MKQDSTRHTIGCVPLGRRASKVRGTPIHALFTVLWMLTLCPVGVAHELADGELERWCEVVVRDDQIQVRYSVGYNPRTQRTIRELIGGNQGATEVSESGATETAVADDREQLARALIAYVAQRVTVQIDGVEVRPERSEALPSGRHPMCWFVELVFAPPPGPASFQLAVVDSAFPSLPGQARQAIRSKSHWTMSEATAAPLIVRARPLVWSAAMTDSAEPRPGARIAARFTGGEQ